VFSIISILNRTYLLDLISILISISSGKTLRASLSAASTVAAISDGKSSVISSKLILIIFMIIGRVELLTILIICKKFLFKN